MRYDLLGQDAGGANGADLQSGAVVVTRPWGGLALRPVTLAGGWYRLDLGGTSAGSLQLVDMDDHGMVELAADTGGATLARLKSGRYQPVFFAAARPGLYPCAGLQLARMSPVAIAWRLARRAWPILKARGASYVLNRMRALSRRDETMGVASASGGLGVLTQADRTGGGALGGTAPAQSGQGFTVRDAGAPAAAEGFTLYVGKADRLTPDALLRFAEAAAANPEALVLIADAWIDGLPTCRPAFDPLLYGGGYPTPFAVRTGAETALQGAWAGIQHRFARIPFPVCDASDDTVAATPPPTPRSRPLATVIIPTRDRADLLAACLAGLFDNTAWPHEVVVVDNGSTEPETHRLLDTYRPKGLKTLRADIPFNFSRLCNLGAAQAAGDYLVFLNNDIVLQRPDWLDHLMACAMLPDAGAAGGRLLYPDRTLQHGGVALGLTQICGHPWRGLTYAEQQRVPQLRHASVRAAVTGAMLCVAKHKFEAAGGFDEDRYPVTLNDIDLCLRLRRLGWFNLYAPDAEALHMEGQSRGADRDPVRAARRLGELRTFAAQWAAEIAEDPWLPQAMSRATETFRWR